MIEIPDTAYAVLGEDRIAYQVFGDGELDVIWFPGAGDCVDLRWDWPPYAEYLEWLAARARVITFDRRGTGSSDAPSGGELPPWEQWADDAQTVMNVVGSQRAVLCALADSVPAAILFAGTHPSRTAGLVLINGEASPLTKGVSEGDVAALTQFVVDAWGGPRLGEFVFPDLVKRDPSFGPWFARSQRLAMTPTVAARAFSHMYDLRNTLSLVQVPTLVLHTEEFQVSPVEGGRHLAEHIAGARFAALPGRDGFPFVEPGRDIAFREIEEFLAGLTTAVVPDRALATILFTDIVGSTQRAVELGDHAWRNLLETHDAISRTLIDQHRGRVVKSTGDGILATFDGPGRAIRCASALGDALRPLGIAIRAGLHTGEVEIRESDIAGIGVHIAARVLAAAAPGEVWVSAAVPMLVAGSGLDFDDRGERELKGVPGAWRLFSVRS